MVLTCPKSIKQQKWGEETSNRFETPYEAHNRSMTTGSCLLTNLYTINMKHSEFMDLLDLLKVVGKKYILQMVV